MIQSSTPRVWNKRSVKALMVFAPVVFGLFLGTPIVNPHLPKQIQEPLAGLYADIWRLTDEIDNYRVRFFYAATYAERNARIVARQASSPEEFKKATDESIQIIQNKATNAMTNMPRG